MITAVNSERQRFALSSGAILMRAIRTAILFIIGITTPACNQAPLAQDKKITQDTIAATNPVMVSADTLVSLLDSAILVDTLEFFNWEPFQFFKSGHLLSKTEKNAITVICPTDTTYTLKLYRMQQDKWELVDTLTNLDAFPIQFNSIFQDYNFDGQTDLYIQVTVSNGWATSRGHLIIIDPKTNRLQLHEEAREFGNMKPDFRTKTIKSESRNYDFLDGNPPLTIFTHKWINGQLKTIQLDNFWLSKNQQ